MRIYADIYVYIDCMFVCLPFKQRNTDTHLSLMYVNLNIYFFACLLLSFRCFRFLSLILAFSLLRLPRKKQKVGNN